MTTTQPTTKYDYDLTSFKTAEDFKNLLERHGLTEFVKVEKNYSTTDRTYHTFAWYNPEKCLVITTNRNPITGEHSEKERNQEYKEMDVEPEKGHCSYVAIEGEKEAVKELVEDFEESAEHIKAGGKEAGYSSVCGAVKERIPYFEGYEVIKYVAQNPQTMEVNA